MVEIQGFKPWTSALPALRSNQLSYIPVESKLSIPKIQTGLNTILTGAAST
jgi:hypothetical protein